MMVVDLLDRLGGVGDRGLGWRRPGRRISSVALAVCPASDLTSEATTAKPLPGLAGARRLDGGVERQQIGLAGDRLNEADHLADAGGGRRCRAPSWWRTGALRILDGAAGHVGGAAGLLGGSRPIEAAAPRPIPAAAGHIAGGDADALLGRARLRRRPRRAALLRLGGGDSPGVSAAFAHLGQHLVDRGLEAADGWPRWASPRCSRSRLAAAWLPANRSRSMMVSRNTRTVRAISPSSSRTWGWAGMRTDASAGRQCCFMASASPLSGRG